MSWNFGDILDAIETVVPADRPALIHGERIVDWAGFSRRTNNLAAQLRARGLEPDDKVALYMRNRPEYCETLAACFKARGVHVNVNFRYLDDELHYILDNSDARVVVYGEEFAERAAKLRDRLPGVRTWIQVDGTPPADTEAYETLAETGDGRALGIERSGDDLLLLYTGGTTGMPKGVMWRAEDLWGALGGGGTQPAHGGSPPVDLAELARNVRDFPVGAKQVPCCPLMHGTGLFTAIGTLSGGGAIATLEHPSFDPVELFDAIEKHRLDSAVIVGDAFGKPMQNALDREPGRWDLSSLKLIVSSGVMWSTEVKRGLLAHHPGLMLVDSFGSSEAVGFGSSLMTAQGETRTARFQIGERCKVFSEDHREIAPGSDERGFIARCGPIPVGYYKDPEKSAKTFPTIGDVRYSIPGDWCTVAADGTLTLLGRGSVCINTAGEKVYPEEVEEALKTHPEVEDALVVGLPDDKWGQAVTGVVEMSPGAACDEAALRAWVRERLAGYKTPKRVFAIERMLRAPNGKADYKGVTEFAAGQAAEADQTG